MEYLIVIGTVTLIHLLGVVTPGPDFIVAVKNSLIYSRRIGIWTAVGFGLGIAVHIFYSLAGLAVIISQSILLFNTIKYIGAMYLIYIGIKSYKSKSSHISVEKENVTQDISPAAAVKMGFLTNVLNPKATLFFLSLFTLVISPSTPAFVLGIMSIIMIVNTILWFSFVAVVLSQKRMQQTFETYQTIFNKTLGGLLVALGLKVALSDK